MHLASYASTNSLRDGFAGVDVFIIDTYVHRKSSNGLNPLCVRRLFRSGWRPFSRPIQPLEDMHGSSTRLLWPELHPSLHSPIHAIEVVVIILQYITCIKHIQPGYSITSIHLSFQPCICTSYPNNPLPSSLLQPFPLSIRTQPSAGTR